jgi:hypothetical protein
MAAFRIISKVVCMECCIFDSTAAKTSLVATLEIVAEQVSKFKGRGLTPAQRALYDKISALVAKRSVQVVDYRSKTKSAFIDDKTFESAQ